MSIKWKAVIISGLTFGADLRVAPDAIGRHRKSDRVYFWAKRKP